MKTTENGQYEFLFENTPYAFLREVATDKRFLYCYTCHTFSEDVATILAEPYDKVRLYCPKCKGRCAVDPHPPAKPYEFQVDTRKVWVQDKNGMGIWAEPPIGMK